jgi:hypothetical protein
MKTTPTVFLMITLGIISIVSFFTLYFIEGNPNLLFHIVAISNLGIWALFVYVLPRVAQVEDPEVKVPPWIMDLIIKSWNEGLDSEERERLRLWYEDEEDPGK